MLLDESKIRQDDGIKIKLSDEVFDGFINNACEYFTILESDLGELTPRDAIDVLSIITDFREYFVSESDWDCLTLQILDMIRRGVSRSMYQDIASFSGMTHIGYNTYGLSLISPKINDFFKGIVNVLLDDLASYTKKSGGEEFNTTGNYEVIKGLSGPLSFLLMLGTEKKIEDPIRKIVNILIRRSKTKSVKDCTVTGWHYFPSATESLYMTEEAKNGVVNYSLSHGMGGPLAALSLAHKNGYRADGLDEAINCLVSEFMKAVYYYDDIACWPGRITFEQYIGQEEIVKTPKQMSWCYGSVGILRVLYLYGRSMPDEKISQFALDELIKIASMPVRDYLLSQPIVCHGFAGTAEIMNLMYLDTGLPDFYIKTYEMIEKSISYNIERYTELEKRLAVERGMPVQIKLHNHLEGYSGIIQTILSIIKGVPNANDKRLLIN